MKKAIPNIITGLSLMSGSLSIIMVLEGNLRGAGWFILIAAVFDFLDGFAARMLNAITSIGKFLDSLSDLVSFGVAPALIFYSLVINSINTSSLAGDVAMNPMVQYFIYVPILLILASAYRLARFTVFDTQDEKFEGIPTTAIGIFTASLALIFTDKASDFWINALSSIYILVSIIIISSVLEVVKLPMINLKFKNFKLKGNVEKYIIVVSGIVLLIWLKWAAIPVIMALYILLSIIGLIRAKSTC